MALKRYKAKIIMEIDATDKTNAKEVVSELMMTNKYPDPWNPVKSFVFKIEEEKEEEEELVN